MVAIKKTPKIILPSSRMTEDQDNLFNNVALQIIHDGRRDVFDGLSIHEKQTVLDWFSTAIVDGTPNNSIYEILWEIDFHRKPVDIETFLTDDYYFGRSCKELHPKWMEDLKYVFAPNSPVMEWIMTGAIGIGKTTIACAAMGYKQYYLSCMRNPPSYYGLLPDSMIAFGIYSITKKQVNDSGYFKLRSFIDSSLYFRRDYPRNMKIDSKVQFIKQNIQTLTGSSNLHAIGMDLFAFMMDEVNFMRAKNDPETSKLTGQAYELYNATYTRLLSRFMRPGGTIPGIMMLLSSRNSQTSFLEERIKIAQGKPSTFVSDYRLWDVKPKHRFTKAFFRVEVGDRIAKSRVLRPEEKPRAKAQVVEVPGEFRERFLEDPDQALRDIAGVATFGLSPLIRDRQSVYDAFKPNLKHPFTRDVVTIDIMDPTTIDQFFDIRAVCRIDGGKWVPKYNPMSPRFIHVDIGITGDCLGFGMAHLAGVKRIKRENPADGTTTVTESPYAMVDLMLQVKPPPGSEIDLEKVRAFIAFLAKLFPVVGVTYDGFQSVDSIQLLKKAGFDAATLSVDIREDPYLSLRSALFERRLAMYRYEPFEDEMLDLQRDISSRKVNHPERSSKGGKGSKDVADAVCGAVWNALTHKQSIAVAKQVQIEDTVVAPVIPLITDPNAPEPALPAVAEIPVSQFPGAPRPSTKADAVRKGWGDLSRNVDG